MALQNFSINLDVYGNLYFSHNKTNITYQLNIDGKNRITLDKGEYKILEPYNKIYKTKQLDENSLKKKVKNDLEENSGSESGSGSEDSDSKYYPEDADFIDEEIIEENSKEEEKKIIDEDLINKYGENNLQFTFWQPLATDTNNINIFFREGEEIMALYDTYIYDINNQLLFKSNSPDSSSIYRLRIFPSGEIYFRPIGYSEQRYILEVANYDDSVICVKMA